MAKDNPPAPEAKAKGGMVYVACKLPAGVVLHLDEMVEFREATPGGGFHVEKRARVKPGSEIVLKGYAAPFGMPARANMAGGYAITPNVPADYWRAWYADNSESALVKNGILYAHERRDHVVAWATEHKAVQSGLEPLDPKGDARVKRGKNGIKVGPADEMTHVFEANAEYLEGAEA